MAIQFMMYCSWPAIIYMKGKWKASCILITVALNIENTPTDIIDRVFSSTHSKPTQWIPYVKSNTFASQCWGCPCSLGGTPRFSRSSNFYIVPPTVVHTLITNNVLLVPFTCNCMIFFIQRRGNTTTCKQFIQTFIHKRRL